MSGQVTAARTGDSIEWRPRWVRGLLPSVVYGVAVWGGCVLMQYSTWALVWLTLVGLAACLDARQVYCEVTSRCIVRLLSDATIEIHRIGVDPIGGVIERAWLGPFGTAAWLRTRAARQFLVVYRVEMSSAGYAALRRHLKRWARRAPLRI